eukprot:1600703-Pyramimonas_sp.AAC.1
MTTTTTTMTTTTTTTEEISVSGQSRSVWSAAQLVSLVSPASQVCQVGRQSISPPVSQSSEPD